MTRPKTWDSMWGGILTDRKLKPHWNWYDGGRAGEGRIVMADKNLQGAAVRSLAGARFERCDFSGANFYLGSLRDLEAVECTFDEGAMMSSSWDRAQLTNCRFHGAWLGFGQFPQVVIDGGDWLGAYLERSTWTGARVTDVSFRAATLVDARLHDAVFTDCDFGHASLFRKELDVDLGTARGARFVRCNFTGAILDGLRLDNTMFDHCVFADMIGKPVLEGPCKLLEASFSAKQPGADIRSEDEILAIWRDRTAAQIGDWARYPPGTYRSKRAPADDR